MFFYVLVDKTRFMFKGLMKYKLGETTVVIKHVLLRRHNPLATGTLEPYLQ